MKKHLVSRLGFFASASALVLAACSSEGPVGTVATLQAPKAPAFVIVSPLAPTTGILIVCIDASSPAATYTIAAAYTTGQVAPEGGLTGDVLTTPVSPTPGNCATVLTKGGSGGVTTTGGSVTYPKALVTLTASTPASGVFSYTCVDQNKPDLCPGGTGELFSATAVGGASNAHGSVVTFKFTPPTQSLFTLTTSVSPAGSGTISPGGSFASGNQIVTATANPGFTFTGFSSTDCLGTVNPCTVAMTQNRNVVANFVAVGVPLFVIGHNQALTDRRVGATVNFWGAQWWKNNFMRGIVDNGVASFKGYASTADNRCGGTWTSRVGNTAPPPATISRFINIIVTSTVTKNGPDIGGDIVEILTIDTEGTGYAPNPGGKEFGVVLRTLCR